MQSDEGPGASRLPRAVEDPPLAGLRQGRGVATGRSGEPSRTNTGGRRAARNAHLPPLGPRCPPRVARPRLDPRPRAAENAVTFMSPATTKFATFAANLGRLAFFIFLILGVPIIIFLPSAGVSLPSVSPIVNQIAETIVYGALAAFGAVCGVFITYVLGAYVYRCLTGVAPKEGAAPPSIFQLFWWCWGAVLCWAAFIRFGNELLEVWAA